ncbi:uncharacterized protein LOC121726173 [Aricia agestis]|uniref:uncharacterized protein LOC121726173 n=1 Tax=Aricia agestis TaxID=91739 RepID=UPI001C20AA14|nr:uncharacterized protein LOC121726173 [Aricia agestis]
MVARGAASIIPADDVGTGLPNLPRLPITWANKQAREPAGAAGQHGAAAGAEQVAPRGQHLVDPPLPPAVGHAAGLSSSSLPAASGRDTNELMKYDCECVRRALRMLMRRERGGGGAGGRGGGGAGGRSGGRR